MDWLEKFPTTKVYQNISSNHRPIFIYLNGIPKNRQKLWRFEHMWLEEEGCRDMIESTWLHDVPSHPMAWFEGKISQCQSKLKWWSRVAIGNITRLLKEKNECCVRLKMQLWLRDP